MLEQMVFRITEVVVVVVQALLVAFLLAVMEQVTL
jgi:hypothetical protein